MLPVLLTYVDESYTDRWFAMAALLVDGPAAVALTNALDRVATAAANAYGLGSGVELHGHEIFHAGRAWSGVPVRARIGVFDDIVEAVAALDVLVIARAMDIVGQRARYRVPDPPHSVVLQHLLERVDECVTGLGDYALVIADEVDGQAKHRADLSSYRDVGTSGYRQRKLTRIVDTLHFAPSHASRLVQAADVITFLYRRTFAHQETDERSRKAKIAMWNRLRPRVHHQRCWFPSQQEGQQHLWAQDLNAPQDVDAQRARYAGPEAVREVREPSRNLILASGTGGAQGQPAETHRLSLIGIMDGERDLAGRSAQILRAGMGSAPEQTSNDGDQTAAYASD